MIDKNGQGRGAGSPPGQALRKAGGDLPMRRLAARIGDMLIEAGLITAKQRNEALAVQSKQGGKTVEILLSLGHLTTHDFVEFLAKQPGVASIDLANYEISADLIELVPKDFAIKHEVFPIDRMGKLLTLGMVCPLDTKTIEKLEELTGLRVKPLLCSADDLRASKRPAKDRRRSIQPIPDRVSGKKPHDGRSEWIMRTDPRR